MCYLFTILLLSVSLCYAQTATPKSATEVKELIDSLTEIKSPGSGFSSVIGGSDFPPVKGQFSFSVGRLNHGVRHQRSEAIARLVALGPHSLPILLKHLDDERKTQMIAEHKGGFGAMWYATEIPIRPKNKAEKDAVKNAGISLKRDNDIDAKVISKHTLTVGDITFAIIGMITNRSYNAQRYQPTACQVINSPTHSPVIAKAVRNIWKNKKFPSSLYESLLADFNSETHLSYRAATRLLYYFPEKSEPLVRAKIDALHAKYSDENSDLIQLLKATSWTTSSELKTHIRNILLNSQDDPELLSAGVLAFTNPEDRTNLNHLLKLTDKYKNDKVYSARSFLNSNLSTFPKDQSLIIKSYLRGASAESLQNFIPSFYGLPKKLIPETKHLLDNRSKGYGFFLINGEGVDKKPTRSDYLDYSISDNFYEIISRALGDIDCKCTGTRKDMNAKILMLKKRLQLAPEKWPFTPAEIVARQKIQNKVKIAKLAREKRINSLAKTREEKWLLTILDRKELTSNVESAVCSLLTPKSWTKIGTETSSIMSNTAAEVPRYRDALTAKQRDQITDALVLRIHKITHKKLKTDALKLACLLSRWSPESARLNLATELDLIAKFPRNHGLKPGKENDFSGWSSDTAQTFTLILHLLKDMLRHDNPEALKAFLGLVKTSGYGVMMDDQIKDEFLDILSQNYSVPTVSNIISELFSDPSSECALIKCTYSDANDLGDKGLLNSPVFRAAFLKAIEKKDIVGKLTVTKKNPEYCDIQWNHNSSSGMGIGKPLGVTPGGKPMDLRFCDALIAGYNNAVFNRNPGPKIQLYWPLKEREAARLQWIQYLKNYKGLAPKK